MKRRPVVLARPLLLLLLPSRVGMARVPVLIRTKPRTLRAAIPSSRAMEHRNTDSIPHQDTADTARLLPRLRREGMDSHTVDMACLRLGKLPMAIHPRQAPEAIHRSPHMDRDLHPRHGTRTAESRP